MRKYEPTQPLAPLLRGRVHKSLAREFFRLYGREPFSLIELYRGLGFSAEQVHEAEMIRLSHDGLPPYQVEPVIEANMRFWGEPFY